MCRRSGLRRALARRLARPMSRGGLIAFANVEITAASVRGADWDQRHRPRLLAQLRDLLNSEKCASGAPEHAAATIPLGICLCEVGNCSEILDADEKHEIEKMVTDAFMLQLNEFPHILAADNIRSRNHVRLAPRCLRRSFANIDVAWDQEHDHANLRKVQGAPEHR